MGICGVAVGNQDRGDGHLESAGDEGAKEVGAARRLASWYFSNNDCNQAVIAGLKDLYVSRIVREMREQGIEQVQARHQLRLDFVLSAEDRIELSSEGVDEWLSRSVAGSSLPETMAALLEAVRGQYNSAGAVADYIAADPTLAAMVLKLVNSSFYRFPRPINSLANAITIIGRRQLRLMAIGITVMSFCRHISEELLDMKAFWMHSIGCGVICKNMMQGVEGADAEHLYLAGLLHDIGHLFMLQEKPALVRAAMRLSETEDCPFHEAEQVIFGFDHCELGSRLMSLWNFPPFLIESVRRHHDQQGDNTETCIVHVADAVAHAAFPGNSGSLRLPRLATKKWERFRLDQQEMERIVRKSVPQFQDLMGIFI